MAKTFGGVKKKCVKRDDFLFMVSRKRFKKEILKLEQTTQTYCVAAFVNEISAISVGHTEWAEKNESNFINYTLKYVTQHGLISQTKETYSVLF